MNLKNLDLSLYLVTNRNMNQNPIEQQVEEAIIGGVTFVQLREKDIDDLEFLKIAKKVKKVTDKYDIPLVMNDNIKIAKEIDCHGVHLGQKDMDIKEARKILGEDKIIGISVSNLDQALYAYENGADYLGVGAVFNTSTKMNTNDLKIDTLKSITSNINIPIVAIGGINKDNLDKLVDTNIDGIAVVSAILKSKDIKNASKILKKQFINLNKDNIKKVLSIAGSDCSGGAGIEADIKTITAHKCYASTVITALTAQNTTGVYGILDSNKDFIRNQLDCVFKDIYPDSVKIGMISSKDIMEVICEKLKEYNVDNIVLDPVMVSTSKYSLSKNITVDDFYNKIFKYANLITPNLKEASLLCGFEIKTKEDMKKACIEISKRYNNAILIKGGHSKEDANDLLYKDNKFTWYKSKRVENQNNHGTGCTLSSSIACNIAKNYSIEKSVYLSKEYVKEALKVNMNIGKGNGPLNHFYNI
ncbi:bifunctional hydroxymethylpyrimidine kinase/phosphomethylpyrimidine kinase [Peptostreptococcaceae bacterium AGR-M142]